MPDRRGAHRRIGFALLGSAAFFVIAGLTIAAGVIDVPAPTRSMATLALCGVALVDALLALKFLLSAAK